MALIGKYKGHLLEGEPVGKEKEFKVTSWTFDGKPAAAKTTKGVVGVTFRNVSAAGIAVYERMNRDFGYPENLKGRHLKFVGTNGDKPARVAKEPKASAPAKATKAADSTAKPAKAAASKPAAKSSAKAPAKAPAKDGAQGPKVSAPSSASKGKASPKASSAVAGKPERRRAQRKPTPLISVFETQEGVAKGQTKFWCHACQASFVEKTAKDGSTPDECPNGHRSDDPEFVRLLSNGASADDAIEELAL